MGLVGMVLGEAAALLKLRVAAAQVRKQVTAEEHWAFAYSMLQRVSRSFALVIQQFGPELRNAVCVFYLVLRALDTVEDDTSINTEVKVPILEEFYRHVYNRDWHFACGTKDYKVLMDKFHYVSTAFSELGPGYQKAIEDITRRMGAGMAKFICKEVETVDDYDEYCHYVAGLVGYGLSRLFHASGSEDLAPDSLSNSMGLFLQKVNITRDYLEDINEIPKSRIFWPREIWSKYSDKLEDFKYEENSTKAVQCLNEMVTNGLIHAEDCLQYISALKDHAIFRFCAIPQSVECCAGELAGRSSLFLLAVPNSNLPHHSRRRARELGDEQIRRPVSHSGGHDEGASGRLQEGGRWRDTASPAVQGPLRVVAGGPDRLPPPGARAPHGSRAPAKSAPLPPRAGDPCGAPPRRWPRRLSATRRAVVGEGVERVKGFSAADCRVVSDIDALVARDLGRTRTEGGSRRVCTRVG